MAALAVCVAATGCARNAGQVIESPIPTFSPTPSANPSPAAPPVPVTLEGPVNNQAVTDLSGMGAAATLEIVMADFAFNPTFVKLAPGANLQLKLKNPGGLADHTFTIEALGVDRQLKPGEQVDLVVQLPAADSFRFYCRLHLEKGMQGAFYFNEGDPISTVSIAPPPAAVPRSGAGTARPNSAPAPGPAPAPAPARAGPRNPGDLVIPDLDINHEDEHGNLDGADGTVGAEGEPGIRGIPGQQGEGGN